MAYEFKFPDVGEGIHEGEIVRWRVKVGDEIKEDQPVVEMETAKAIVEIPSPKSGTVLAVIGKEGEVIHVGATLVVIGAKGEKWEPNVQLAGASAAANVGVPSAGAPASAGPGVVGQIPTEEKGVVLPARGAPSVAQSLQAKGTAVPVQHNIMPRIRKIAQDLGVDINKVQGTGPGGQITEDDVKKSPAGGAGATMTINFEKWGPVEKIPVQGIRKAIAEHMVKSAAAIPHVTHMDECDAANLIKVRESKKAEAEKKGIKLTYLAFIVKAVCEVLKKHPFLNAAFTGPEIICKKYYNIGIAVDTDEGLMVPIIKNADQKDVFQIAKEIIELAAKCRERKITLPELDGGTFTLTNVGSIGGIFATPIIPYGNTAELGVMRMKEKPVAVNGKVEIRPILTLALAFDHRALDGAQAARAMNDLKSYLENLQ